MAFQILQCLCKISPDGFFLGGKFLEIFRIIGIHSFAEMSGADDEIKIIGGNKIFVAVGQMRLQSQLHAEEDPHFPFIFRAAAEHVVQIGIRIQ